MSVSTFIPPAIYAVLVWWSMTGVILYLDGLAPRTFRSSMLGATAALGAAAYAVRVSADDVSPGGAYAAFSAAILIWGWLEMSFLMGFISGPRKQGCHGGCGGTRHFFHAAAAVIYNELATLVFAAGIGMATWHAPNRLAFDTFLILWIMRLSAKLNLFLGVKNAGEQYLPAHLKYLKSFFGRRAVNSLFPISVCAATIAVALLLKGFAASKTPFAGVEYALSASLLALAVLEHWFMILPLPSEKMWTWAMRSRALER